MHFHNSHDVNPLVGHRPPIAAGIILFSGSEITIVVA